MVGKIKEVIMKLIRLYNHPEQLDAMAMWFHQKWGIPLDAYQESMRECLLGKEIPQWYVMMHQDIIVGGLGVIANDFHPRTDLSPNVCAVYVEEEYRNQGIAGQLLQYVCEDMHSKGIDTLYLLTDHTSFYERYGWQFYCEVMDDSNESSRMYIHIY